MPECKLPLLLFSIPLCYLCRCCYKTHCLQLHRWASGATAPTQQVEGKRREKGGEAGAQFGPGGRSLWKLNKDWASVQTQGELYSYSQCLNNHVFMGSRLCFSR